MMGWTIARVSACGRARRAWGVAAICLLMAAAPSVRAAPPELTPASRRAVERGLAWLAAAQSADGSWESPRYGRNVGITSLAAMALMSDGNLPGGRGRYSEQVTRAIGFVLDHAEETGLIAADVSHGPMYGHSFAVLMLAEAYGHSADPRLRGALVKSVQLILDAQNDQGGWRYHPTPMPADISVTVGQINALRAARNAGIDVPKEAIDLAVQYVRRCQNPSDGGFNYMLNIGGSAFARSAGGVCGLMFAGIYDDPAVERGLRYLEGHRPEEGEGPEDHFYYGHYYAVQAMFVAGGERWADWFPAIRERLLDRQQVDGRWRDGTGDAYGTAMALLILQTPNRYLPIFQR